MSGILSSLNKSGQFMSDEKKKGGFWSWFGLGKNKQETSTEPKAPESQKPLSHEPETQDVAQETAEKTTALLDETARENPSTEETLMAQASTLVPEVHEAQSEITQSEEDGAHAVKRAPSVEVETFQEENPAAQAWTLAPSDESTQSIEETLENPTALSASEAEVQVESAVDIKDEFIAETEEHEEESAVADMAETQEKPSEGGFFSRLLKGLVKTKQNIGAGFRSFFLGKKIDDELFEELEEQLLIADIGVPTTTKIINNLTQHATRQQLQNADTLYQQLKLEMGEILKPVAQPLRIDGSKKPYVILMVGVNGVGKTTTIGKLARKFQMEGKSVMLAAGDTFRAAAVEQLQVWGERNHIPVVAQSTGSDSASVIFDAMQSAAARNIDVLIADTAGRLQNKNNLMDELKKIVRVMKKYDESAPHEIMLTLDAGTGQNAISQAKLFNEAVGLTGISLTKLDGTAKGGVIFAIADQFNLPIRYIGVGEKIEDLREFNAEEFIDALFAHEEE
ncbi:signal recognition particle-docking protein FtsY [Aggregatibacter sp. oral taxon 458 str. W10330]|nr:signal recognition particle-docking protein FtsY [Aggregatibacter sp. oral taxon 458 str. W10330]